MPLQYTWGDVILYAFGFVFLEKSHFPRNSVGVILFPGSGSKMLRGSLQSSRDMLTTQSLAYSPYCGHPSYSTGKHKRTIKTFCKLLCFMQNLFFGGRGLQRGLTQHGPLGLATVEKITQLKGQKRHMWKAL